MAQINNLVYIGIDPGKSGGIAILGQKLCEAYDFDDPKMYLRIVDFGQDVFSPFKVVAFIEKVGASPQQGATSAFTFGKHTGIAIGLCMGLQIPIVEVAPIVWQKVIFGPTVKKNKALLAQGQERAVDEKEARSAANKNQRLKKEKSRQKAIELFPHMVDTDLKYKQDHNKAEALLIAEYGRRVRVGS